jgi:hypothetical protein
MLQSVSKNNSGVWKNCFKTIPLAFFPKNWLKLAHFEHLAISESIPVQSWIWLLVHVQEELLHLLPLFFTWNTIALLLTFKSKVLNYIYFTQVIRPSIILQDKNLTNIYFDRPEKELNYKLCF